MNEEQTTALALIPARELTPQIWQMISQMAPVMYRSRLFGVTSQEAAAAIMLKGYELGLSVTASFEFIHVIQGKPGLSPRGALALLHSHPDIENVIVNKIEEGGKYIGHECTIKRKNGFSFTARFTLEDARRAGLVRPESGWEKYPEQMCMWRAIGFAADVAAPDITAGLTSIMKMPEEMGIALDGSGEIINVQAREPEPERKATITLDDLLTQYGAEAIMEAAGGKIPATQEEVEEVYAKLRG